MATLDHSHIYSLGNAFQYRGSWHRITFKLPQVVNDDKVIICNAPKGLVYLGIQGFYAPDSAKLAQNTVLKLGLFEDPVDSGRPIPERNGKTFGRDDALGTITAAAAGAFTLNTPNYDQPLETTYRYGFGVDHKIMLSVSGLANATTPTTAGVCLDLWLYLMHIGEGAGGVGNGGGVANVKAGVAPLNVTEQNTTDVYKLA